MSMYCLPNVLVRVARRALSHYRPDRITRAFAGAAKRLGRDGSAHALAPHANFEQACMARFRTLGWKVRPVRGARSTLLEYDSPLPLFIARKGRYRLAVHCRPDDAVTDDDTVLDIFNVTAWFDGDQILIVSPHGYTALAHQLSRALGVRLLNPADLLHSNNWLEDGQQDA